MDGSQFDRLTRRIAPDLPSRRGVMRLLAATALGTPVLRPPTPGAAKKKKVTLCLDGQTLSVSKKAKKKYLQRGAALGDCPSPPPPPPPPPQPPAGGCTPNCSGKVCGQSDGCNGTCSACPNGKRCENGQCVDDPCTRDCAGKDCGADDGCGGTCTRQQGCSANQTCVDGQCVTNACSQGCPSDQHCCDPFGFGVFGCWNCCDDQDCIDNPVFNAQGRIVCQTGGCNCPADRPTLCPAGFGAPGQFCTDPRSDKANCFPNSSSCGFSCPNHPDWECCNGTCSYLPKCTNGANESDCKTDHCGTCGSPCNDDGVGCCNGACVVMTQDPNCGVCGADCSTIGQTCDGGICHVCECEEEGGD